MNYVNMRILGEAMNELRKARQYVSTQEEVAASILRCVGGAGLDAADLLYWRISKRLIGKRSSAKLKIVG